MRNERIPESALAKAGYSAVWEGQKAGITHLAHSYPELKISGALLVAPADIDKHLDIADGVGKFRPIPHRTLPFPLR